MSRADLSLCIVEPSSLYPLASIIDYFDHSTDADLLKHPLAELLEAWVSPIATQLICSEP